MLRKIEDALFGILFLGTLIGLPVLVYVATTHSEQERAQEIQRHEAACHRRGLMSFEEVDRHGRSSSSFWVCIDPKTNQVFWPTE